MNTPDLGLSASSSPERAGKKSGLRLWRIRKGVQRPQRIRVKPKDEAVYYASRGKDREGLDVKFINSLKGRVVFAKRHLERGEFLVEYRGDLMEKKKYERRVKLYHKGLKVFMFEFCYNGKQLCIDAAKEDGSLGRLVNDDHINPNGKIKTVTVKGHPHLCVFATKDIKPKEAITYNNGDSDWPWRMKISEDKHPADDDTPIATTSLPDEKQISEDRHPADDDTPKASTSLPDEKQISEDRHPADDDTPKASTSLPDEKQISEDRHPADNDTPKASTSLPDEKQISEDRHPADDDTPKASTSLPDEKQISEDRHPADDDTPKASTSLPDEKQISEDRHPADDDTPKASTSLPDEKQSFQHKVGSSSASSFEKCAFCHGPLSARKWICVKYKALPENYAEMEDPRRKQKRPWSPKEIAAVMRHFQEHIANGKLATVVEIKQCRSGEHPTLASRPVQNIIDFVRNRGLIQKRKKQQKENSC
ncbi:uncharacterized protein LOC105354252 isoform X4 [Oryzias latipes]